MSAPRIGVRLSDDRKDIVFHVNDGEQIVYYARYDPNVALQFAEDLHALASSVLNIPEVLDA